MTDYFLRCKVSDLPTLYTLAQALGVLNEDNQPAHTSTVWDELGQLHKPTGTTRTVTSTYEVDGVTLTETVDIEDVALVCAPDGELYHHINLRFDGNLAEIAQGLGGDVAAIGLANLGRWFVVDSEGRATRPAAPACVFA